VCLINTLKIVLLNVNIKTDRGRNSYNKCDRVREEYGFRQ